MKHLVISLLVLGAATKTFEATIRYPGGSQGRVTIEASDSFMAKDQIIARYCGGMDCIIQGPWERH
jgi:hypothetical protein